MGGDDLGVLLASWGGCPPIVSNCCGALPSVGCNTPPCQACVRNLDPFRCEIEWDGICAFEASNDCEALCLCPQ